MRGERSALGAFVPHWHKRLYLVQVMPARPENSGFVFAVTSATGAQHSQCALVSGTVLACLLSTVSSPTLLALFRMTTEVDMYCQFIVEVSDTTALADRIKVSHPNSMRINSSAETKTKTFVLHAYDLKNAGEASSHPSVRLPPLRGNGEHLKQCIRAGIDSYNSVGNSMAANDLFLLFDGGRPGPILQLQTKSDSSFCDLTGVDGKLARHHFSAPHSAIASDHLSGTCSAEFPAGERLHCGCCRSSRLSTCDCVRITHDSSRFVSLCPASGFLHR